MYRASLTTDEDRYSGRLQSTASSRRGRRRHYPRRSSATSEAPSSEEEHQDDDDDQELQHGTPSFALSLLGPAIDGEDENPRPRGCALYPTEVVKTSAIDTAPVTIVVAHPTTLSRRPLVRSPSAARSFDLQPAGRSGNLAPGQQLDQYPGRSRSRRSRPRHGHCRDSSGLPGGHAGRGPGRSGRSGRGHLRHSARRAKCHRAGLAFPQ